MRAMIGVALVVTALALAGCTNGDNGLNGALRDEGATPGTVPDGAQPDGTLRNGLTPEPWGDTS